jgi:hypothetical protein
MQDKAAGTPGFHSSSCCSTAGCGAMEQEQAAIVVGLQQRQYSEFHCLSYHCRPSAA